jgi:hypothetical protein
MDFIMHEVNPDWLGIKVHMQKWEKTAIEQVCA